MKQSHNVPDSLPLKEPVQKRSIETRRKIMEAARELFKELGFDETTTHLIAERAGLSVGGIYAHFKNKEEVFLHILEVRSQDSYNTTHETLGIIRDQGMPLDEALEFLFENLYQVHMKNGKLNLEMQKFCLMNETAGRIHDHWEQAEVDEVRALMKEYPGDLKVNDVDAAMVVISRAVHEVFQFLYQEKSQVDDQAVLKALITMIKKFLLA